MNTCEALDKFSSIINDGSLTESARIIDSSFVRERKIPLSKLLVYLIFRNKKVLSEDMSHFFGEIPNWDIPTKQAMIKRINILNFDVWDTIMEKYRTEIYSKLCLYTLKDYIIISFDGSFLDLPEHTVTKHYFGGYMTKKMTVDDIQKPQAKVSMAYDVLNKAILDFSVSHYRTSEIPMMFEHLEKIMPVIEGKKVIFLMDRYYGSAEFFKYCEMNSFKYIVRAKSNFFKKQVAEHNGEDDFDIHINFDEAWIKRMKHDFIREAAGEDPTLDIRVIRGKYTYFEKGRKTDKEITIEGTYFTNLGDEFGKDEIIDIYHHDRWNIETAYDVLKTDLDIEQINTHNPIGIKNEIMGKVVFYNIEKMIWIASESKIKTKNNLKYRYIPNNKNIINILHTVRFIREFLKGLRKATIRNIIKSCAREKIPIREGRHYRRWGKFHKSVPQRRHRIDGRRNPPVKITKVGILTSNT